MPEELIDVLDDKGKKTEEVLSKSSVHEHELWHGSIHAWIVNPKGQILLQFRGPDKKLFPNCWDTSVAGHIAAGESPKNAAVREISEEIGIEIGESELEQVSFVSEQLPFIAGGTHREHNWVFVVHKDLDVTKLRLQKSEVVKTKWFKVDELEAILASPERRKELSKHDDKLFRLAINEARKCQGTNEEI